MSHFASADKRIDDLLSSNFGYLVHDCARPSYINVNHSRTFFKEHPINSDMNRKDKQEPSRFICNTKSDGLWRFNPKHNSSRRSAYVGFVDSSLGRDQYMYSAYVTLMDEKMLEGRFNEFITKGKNFNDIDDVKQDKIGELVRLVFTMTHHPRYYKVDPKINSTLIKFFKIDEPDVPKWVRDPTEETNYLTNYTDTSSSSSSTTSTSSKNKINNHSHNHHQSNSNNNKNKNNNKTKNKKKTNNSNANKLE